ncbi:uncharacterized protein C1orf131 [Neocloeon triangulifer]|uniref:uncharacterized protein C1orf131 n=1 Tax=Neocloeon triangulifer TaxID=2078957 RepID=UPI00286FA4EC|nr:uncharacterized protein C1orf131 [Neocloeon triangulifer]
METRVLTKAAAFRLNEPSPVEVVIFNERRSKKEQPSKPILDSISLKPVDQHSEPQKPFSMKKARFEVTKLAMTSLKAASKVEAKEALALSLGARPKKRSAVNYKELKAQKAAEKEIEEQEEKLRSLGKILKRTGRKTSSGRTMGSGTAPSKKTKGTPKAVNKLKTGILGKYGKVDKAKIKAIKSSKMMGSGSKGKGKR